MAKVIFFFTFFLAFNFARALKVSSVQDVLDSYYKLTKSLAIADQKKAFKAIKELKVEILENGYSKYFEGFLNVNLPVESIADQRNALAICSIELRKILPYAESLEEVVYVVYFPRPDKSRAIWLSSDLDFVNPYSDSTKSCKLMETIKPMVK